MTLARDALHNRIRGCLAGVAIGDALGMPWETCTQEEILEVTQGTGATDLQDLPAEHPRKVNDPRGIALGNTTDDWQLTKAVATSLIRSRSFHLFDQAAAHIEAYETSTQGWGGSTRRAIAEFKRWFDSRGREGRRPDCPANPEDGRGKGNGVLMKLAPLACMVALERAASGLHNAKDQALRATTKMLTKMTHVEDISPDFASVLLASLEGRLVSIAWPNLRPMIHNDEVRTTLENLFARRADVELPTIGEIRAQCGTSFLASESATYCLSVFMLHPQDFRAALFAAINGGGDTDTNASITGALLGSHLGLEAIPPAWMAAIPDAAHALRLADQLIATFG